jgi:hypothetical protein
MCSLLTLSQKNWGGAMKKICSTTLSNNKIDVFVMGSCLMSCEEMAYGLKGYVKYIVATEDDFFDNFIDTSAMMQQLENSINADDSANAFSNSIVASNKDNATILSNVDVDLINSTDLKKAIDTLSADLLGDSKKYSPAVVSNLNIYGNKIYNSVMNNLVLRFPSNVTSEFFFDFVSKVRRSCVQFPAVCLIPAPLPLPYSRNNTPTAPFLQVLNSLCAAA